MPRPRLTLPARSATAALIAVGITTAAALTVVAPPAALAEPAPATVSGDLSAKDRSDAHRVTLEDGEVEATLTFTVRPAPAQAPTARLTVLDPGGAVVAQESGPSPVSVSVDATAGSYRFRVSTQQELTGKRLDYTLDIAETTVADTPSPSPSAGADLRAATCGTWVLQQVSSAEELTRLQPRLEDALALPGVVGLSVRFPWDAADLTGSQTTHPLLDRAHQIASAAGKPLSIRFMAGAHTPRRVFDAGAAHYLNPQGRKVPLPWDNATGTNDVFLSAYDEYVGRLAAWSRSHGVSLLHLSWYGQDWAELNHGKEVRAAAGYTQSAWLQGHRELIRVGAGHASDDLAVELPLSGYGPLSGGQSAALADEVIGHGLGDAFVVQANGWGPAGEWGAPDATVESQFDAIWSKPVPRGLQMIQPDGYDWSVVFDRLDAVGATYGEVYLPSFWQVPGPSPTYNHNTTARIAQLEAEIAAFAERSC